MQPYEFVRPAADLELADAGGGPVRELLPCQPKCAEPWLEVKVEDEKQGKVLPRRSIIRLTIKPNTTIDDIGSPDRLITSLGPFVTGNAFDSDMLVDTTVDKNDGKTVTEPEPALQPSMHSTISVQLCELVGLRDD